MTLNAKCGSLCVTYLEYKVTESNTMSLTHSLTYKKKIL